MKSQRAVLGRVTLTRYMDGWLDKWTDSVIPIYVCPETLLRGKDIKKWQNHRIHQQKPKQSYRIVFTNKQTFVNTL